MIQILIGNKRRKKMSKCKVKKGPWLIIFLLLALAVALTNAFLSNRLQNTIKGNILNLFANISYSYIVSYIFYLVALLPSRRDKKLLLNYVINKSSNISEEIDGLFDKLFSEFNLKKSPENFTVLCNKIDLSKTSKNFFWMSIKNGQRTFYNPTYGAFIDSMITSIEKNIQENENLFLIADNKMYGITQSILQSKFFTFFRNALYKDGEAAVAQSLTSFDSFLLEIYNKNEEIKQRIDFIKKENRVNQ